jgi:hypothetical protein
LRTADVAAPPFRNARGTLRYAFLAMHVKISENDITCSSNWPEHKLQHAYESRHTKVKCTEK